jgi:hypothetical protein
MEPAVPRHWEKRILAAYLRMLGASQEAAGVAVRRSERTVFDWEHHASWPLAREEARQRWLSDLTDASRKALLDSIRGGAGDLAFKVLERVDRDLAPPAHRLQHQHEVGEGLSGLLQAFGAHDADLG